MLLRVPFGLHHRSLLPYYILLIAGIAAGIAYSPLHDQFVFDDTYITFRYSMNIADGYGLVWNPGLAPEEGYTSMLYVLLMVIPSYFMEDPLLIAQAFNVACVLVTAMIIFKFGKRVSDSIFLPVTLSLLFLVSPLTWANAFTGMETSVFGLLVLWTIYLFICTRHVGAAYFLAFVCGLARPEGWVLGMLIVAYEFVRRRSFPQASLWYLAPLAIYLVAKTAYYGYLLPNPFVFKASVPGHAFKLFGLAYVKMFVISILPIILLIAFGSRQWIRDKRIVPLAFIAAILLFYTLPVPLMGFHDRFLYSVMVVAFALSAGAPIMTMGWTRLAAVPLLGIQAMMLFLTPRAAESLSGSSFWQYNSLDRIGTVLREFPERRSIRVATTEAGILPFRSQMEVIDLIGLNTRDFATEKIPSQNIDRLFSLHPDLLVLLSTGDSMGIFHTAEMQHGMSMKEHHKIPVHKDFERYEPLIGLHVVNNVYMTISVDRSSKHYPELKEHILTELRDVEGTRLVESLRAVTLPQHSSIQAKL